MANLAEEKMHVENKVNSACIKIQRFARMRIARKKYLRMREEHEQDGKERLLAALNEMEQAVAHRKQLSVGIDEAALRIQRATRNMLSRLRFRNCLYKLIIFKNIVENKVHKEKMSMLFAFEQLIINTEEQLEEEEALEAGENNDEEEQ